MLLDGKFIFIVEDNLQNRIIFQMSLIREGARVEFERSGQDTLYRLRNMNKIDLIILDLMLANHLSGFDVMTDIKAHPTYSQIPVVAVSAMDAAIAIPQAQALGFHGFIPKPVNERQFPKLIARILAGEEVWNASERTLL